MSIDRNAVFDALTVRLKTGLENLVPTVQRSFFWPAPEQMPALIVGSVTEWTNEEESAALPAKWKCRCACHLWLRAELPGGPARDLQTVQDAVETALKLQPGEGPAGYWTTLGGLAWHAAFMAADTLVDDEAITTGLATLRIEVLCKPVR